MADEPRDARHSAVSTRRNSDTSGHQTLAGPPISQNPSSLSTSLHIDPIRRRHDDYGGTYENAPGKNSSLTNDMAGTPSRLQPREDTTPRAKKPAMLRRPSSAYPHKGQEFSVDDAEEEVAIDLVSQKRHDRQDISNKPGGMIRTATIRRKPAAQPPSLPNLPSSADEETEIGQSSGVAFNAGETLADMQSPQVKPFDALDAEQNLDGADEEASDVSDAESFTLKDRQDAINVTHPFGIRLWKPALYKKRRSVLKTAEDELHSSPGLNVSRWLVFFNYLWTIFFGWWLSTVCLVCALFCFVCGAISPQATAYAHVSLGLAAYLFYPFGKFIKLLQEEAYAEEDQGEGRSITEYEQWQSGDIEEGRLFFGPLHMNRSLVGRRRTSVESSDETTSLLGRYSRGQHAQPSPTVLKTRFFGRGDWSFGRIAFYLFFYLFITPCLFLTCGINWFLVFPIPMGKLTWLLWDHLRRHPLALSFHTHSGHIRHDQGPSSVLVCTYRAVGLKYWKYTIDGTNIFLFNLLVLTAFTIFDYFVLAETLHLQIFITNQGLIFALSLLSIIPLAYFIGQAVASISAQSSMGVGATVNAFFSTVVEVYLYCIALAEGKAPLVEGSIIGSIFAGILFLPGLSMCFGALKRKTQRFNVKSAGVTSTMMLFAMIGVFGPTLFYQIYGSHELKCHDCSKTSANNDCRRCFFSQVPDVHDRFYTEAVLPFSWFSAMALFFSYVIGLLFTLRTHAAIIWSGEADEKRGPDVSTSQLISHTYPDEANSRHVPGAPVGPAGSALPRVDVRDSQMYQRVLGQSLRQSGIGSNAEDSRSLRESQRAPKSPHIVPPNHRVDPSALGLDRLSDAENMILARQMAEMAATAAVVATRDVARVQRRLSNVPEASPRTYERAVSVRSPARAGIDAVLHPETAPVHEPGGHDAPNWSKKKSSVILLSATVAYAIIAEILVNTVDVVLDNIAIDQKFLGMTLFALVPNTTEFLNAISFAMNGNIALSMEIGSAYALQVCLLQIPALVLYSALYGRYINPDHPLNYIFTLIFPQWDMVTVILCIFLLSYMYGEGKSNYFKGSILILAYSVVIVGFWFAAFDPKGGIRGVHQTDTLALAVPFAAAASYPSA